MDITETLALLSLKTSKIVDKSTIQVTQKCETKSFLCTIIDFVKNEIMINSIDESHGLIHSLKVVHNVTIIFNEETIKSEYTHLSDYLNVVVAAAALHDMADSKYFVNVHDMNRQIIKIRILLESVNLSADNVDMVINIINTMSYSKIKKYGYPTEDMYGSIMPRLCRFVSEADLIEAYCFERCMSCNMYIFDGTSESMFDKSYELFKSRMFKHNDDKMLTTDYAIKIHKQSIKKLNNTIKIWKSLIE